MTHTSGEWIASKEDGTNEWNVKAGEWNVALCFDHPGNGTAEGNARLIAAAKRVLEELRYAHQIIHNARQIMTTEQKLKWCEANEADGLIEDGITRHHERGAAIAAATGAQP